MARATFASVDDYLESQPEPARSALERVRSVVRKALPGAEEGISYQIPTYKLHGRTVIHFAGFTQHFSLYPSTRYVVETLGDAVAPHVVSKGTMRFSLSEPIPVRLIGAIAKARAKEVADEVKTRTATTTRATKKRAASRPAAKRGRPARQQSE